MNTERLFEILSQIDQQVAETGLVQKLDQLIEFIGQQVGDPSNASHQQNFANARKDLSATLSGSWFARLTPLETEVLDQMGLTYLVGNRLPNRLTVLMRENGMLPAVVRDEFSSISEQIKSKLATTRQTKKNLDSLGFAAESLEPQTGELAYRIPRPAIDDRYESFLSDAEFYKSFASTMSEIVLGQTPELKLRGLSSSAFSIFLSIDPQVVAFIVLAIERVLNGYKTLLEVRVLRDQLKERAVPEDVLAQLEKNTEERMERVFRQALDSAIKEIKAQAKKERLNELKNHATILLRQLIESMERGYEVDARVGYSDVDPEDQAEKSKNDEMRDIDASVRKSIEAVRRTLTEAKRLNAIEHQPNEDIGDIDSEKEE